MDKALVEDYRARLAFEEERTSAPSGFPKFPDLPLGRYTDPSFFEAELDTVFRRNWLYAGHISEFQGPGSYRVLDLPWAPIVVVKGADGEVRAFLNACRHRGAPVVRAECGKARLLVCQFHSWSYDLTGRLVRVPDESDFVGLECDERALTSVRCEMWGGLIFINLDPEAPPLLDWMAPVVQRYSDLAEGNLRPIYHRRYDAPCNWKVIAEAFIEVYHVKTVHPTTGSLFFDTSHAAMVLHPGGHSSMLVPIRKELLPTGQDEGDLQWKLSDDATWIADAMGGLPRVPGAPDLYWQANASVHIFPNTFLPMDSVGFPVLVYTPLAIDRTQFDVTYYAVDWGDGERPGAWDVRLAAWELLTDEDMVNLAPIQRSLTTAAHGGIPLNYQERRIWELHAQVDRCIGADRIPEDLRVPTDLLVDYLEP